MGIGRPETKSYGYRRDRCRAGDSKNRCNPGINLETLRQIPLPRFFPVDLILPIVAPSDLGDVAARRLTTPVSDTGVRHVEGPERYSAREVAHVFS